MAVLFLIFGVKLLGSGLGARAGRSRERLLLAVSPRPTTRAPITPLPIARVHHDHAAAPSGSPKSAWSANTVAVPASSTTNAHAHHHTSSSLCATSTISSARTIAITPEARSQLVAEGRLPGDRFGQPTGRENERQAG